MVATSGTRKDSAERRGSRCSDGFLELLRRACSSLRSLMQHDALLLTGLPPEVQRLASREQLLALLRWMQEVHESAIPGILQWISRPQASSGNGSRRPGDWNREGRIALQVPFTLLLGIPPSRLRAPADATEPSLRELTAPWSDIPGVLLGTCGSAEDLAGLRDWKVRGGPRSLEALEQHVARAADRLPVLRAALALPRALSVRCTRREALDQLVQWMQANSAACKAAAALAERGQLNLDDCLAVPPSLLHLAADEKVVVLLARLAADAVGRGRHQVQLAAALVSSQFRGQPGPSALFLSDLAQVPTELLQQAETGSQLLALARLSQSLANGRYIPISRLAPESAWRRIAAGEFGALFEAAMGGVPVALKIPHKASESARLTPALALSIWSRHPSGGRLARAICIRGQRPAACAAAPLHCPAVRDLGQATAGRHRAGPRHGISANGASLAVLPLYDIGSASASCEACPSPTRAPLSRKTGQLEHVCRWRRTWLALQPRGPDVDVPDGGPGPRAPALAEPANYPPGSQTGQHPHAAPAPDHRKLGLCPVHRRHHRLWSGPAPDRPAGKRRTKQRLWQ